jgi:hypothetical protein
MSAGGRDYFQVDPRYQPIMRQIGLDAETVFSHPDIKVWRSIPERENCTLDATFDGRAIRLHIKRYRATRRSLTPADEESHGIQALLSHDIPTVPLVGWGRLADGRSFVMTEDLSGFRAGDKVIESGFAFDRLLFPTADLTAKLHTSRLHHRDLYLCHFFVRADDDNVELRLIDAARVRPLPRWLKQRWIVKDLAQFWYSATQLSIPREQLMEWLKRYANCRMLDDVDGLARAIERKCNWIARHDRKLNQSQPRRNISIPQARGM